jgi:hypothetical protein
MPADQLLPLPYVKASLSFFSLPGVLLWPANYYFSHRHTTQSSTKFAIINGSFFILTKMNKFFTIAALLILQKAHAICWEGFTSIVLGDGNTREGQYQLAKNSPECLTPAAVPKNAVSLYELLIIF